MIEDRDRFVRIANARLKSKFPFGPQRNAVVGKMWRDYYDKKNQK
jgi:hypothetical protein